jgi:glycosyltransferase involved in cell wall biosynthesis
MVLPALVAFLRARPEVSLHLFGTFERPAALEEFGERVSLFAPIRDYAEFRDALAGLEWDIGICPLARNEFNLLKANNKWIEYTSVGAAVVASRGTVYDESCAGGCGILVETHEDWVAALEALASDPAERAAQVRRAQEKLAAEYSPERLREQILEIIAEARMKRA